MKAVFVQVKTYILFIAIFTIIILSTLYGIMTVYTSVDRTNLSERRLNTDKSNFKITLEDMRYFQKANLNYRTSDDKKIVINNDKRIVKDIKTILSNKESLNYDNKNLEKLLGLNIYNIVGDKNSRIIRYTTNEKVYGKNNKRTYEFFQGRFQGKTIVKEILSGQEKFYEKFYVIILNDKDKEFLCLGADYSRNPNTALIEAFDYNLGQTANKVKSLLVAVTDNGIPWYTNSIDGTVKVGESNLEGTYISEVRNYGKEIYISATDECKRYLGYNPESLKLELKDDGYTPICSCIQPSNEVYLAETEKRAINAVKNTNDVRQFRDTLKDDKQNVYLNIESTPTKESPIWRIRVAQDYYGHISTYNIYSVNARTCKVVSKDFEW